MKTHRQLEQSEPKVLGTPVGCPQLNILQSSLRQMGLQLQELNCPVHSGRTSITREAPAGNSCTVARQAPSREDSIVIGSNPLPRSCPPVSSHSAWHM